jgi:hypothetical protein
MRALIASIMSSRPTVPKVSLEIVLHEINQFIGVFLCGDRFVPRLLCTRSGCFSSSLLLFSFPALSLGFCFLRKSSSLLLFGFPALSLGFCFLRKSFSSLTVCLGSGCKRGKPSISCNQRDDDRSCGE